MEKKELNFNESLMLEKNIKETKEAEEKLKELQARIEEAKQELFKKKVERFVLETDLFVGTKVLFHGKMAIISGYHSLIFIHLIYPKVKLYNKDGSISARELTPWGIKDIEIIKE